MSWDGEKLTIDNRECVRCMHCINVMPKALRPGQGARRDDPDRRQGAHRAGRAALVASWSPSFPRRSRYETIKELIKRIWEFWDEHGKNRERVGELIQRVGMGNFLDAHRSRAGAGDGLARRATTPTSSSRTRQEARRGGKQMTTRHRNRSESPILDRRTTRSSCRRSSSGTTGSGSTTRSSRPACSCHVAESGEKLYTVRAGSPRLLSVQTIRLFADLADKYCGGYLRFTSRNNVEFLLDEPGQYRAADRASSRQPATRSAAPATPSATSSTRRAGCTATRRPPTPPASSSP